MQVDLNRSDVSSPEQALDQSERRTGFTCVFLNTYYPGFLDHHYRTSPDLSSRTYREQHRSLQSACFGDSDFYSSGLREAGWEADDLIANCQPLQRAWAIENGSADSTSSLAIAVEQIRRAKPDVLYFQDLGIATSEFFSAIRTAVGLVVGQIASPIPPQAHMHGFDLIVSSFPHFVQRFRQAGIPAIYQPLAFDPRVLTRLQPAKGLQRHGGDAGVTFVGGISPAHRDRKILLEQLAARIPMEFWGYGTESLSVSSEGRQRCHGAVWGMDMFGVLGRSAITINHHIDVAERYANNMRLFEATGCGALLVTDYKDNLGDLFDVGSEVVAYRSPDECTALVQYYLAHQDEATAIARRGQARTLREHSYAARMRQTADVLERLLRRKRFRSTLPRLDPSTISYGWEPITATEISPSMTTAWQSPEIPARQRALVEQELEDMYHGKPPTVYRVLADSVRPFVRSGERVLEIGCASGYYLEALEYLLGRDIAYTGVDYSDAMVGLAKQCYPRAAFFVADGACLPFADHDFALTISSGVLLHVTDYDRHIAEAARVASRIVVLHRTPICKVRPTQHFKKRAYGVETFELRFEEQEILTLSGTLGLRLIMRQEYAAAPARDEYEVTYVFGK